MDKVLETRKEMAALFTLEDCCALYSLGYVTILEDGLLRLEVVRYERMV